MKYSLLALLILPLFTACSSEQKPLTFTEMNSSQLFDRYKKNVVLIKNKSYFRVAFDNNKVLYATGLDGETGGFVSFSEQEAADRAETKYGTGFFVGNKGIIATNFHVVAPVNSLIENTNINESIIFALTEKRSDAKEDLYYQVNSYVAQYHDSDFIRRIVPENLITLSDLSAENSTEILDSAATYRNKIDSLVKTLNIIDEAIASKAFTITIQTAELSISMDASTGNAKEYPCHIYSLTDDSHADLALIQTDDKEIPEGAEQNLDLYRTDTSSYKQTLLPWDTLKVTTPLFLISYNYGEAIAKTADGIKVQLTQGNVSQENDRYRVLYSIPALPGSSGGPVFNKKGQLVAINYCGYTQQGNFNYGVLSFQLKKLIEKPPILKVLI